MKSFALLCFLLLASACVFVARADDEKPAVDEPKMADQPEAADVTPDDEQTEADEDETEADDESDDEESEEDEEETTDVADDEPEKRGWVCRRYRRGKLWCKACGCRPICRPKRCTRRVCRRVKCTKRVCRTVTRYRIIRYKYRLPYSPGYGPRYVWKTRKVPYKVVACKTVLSLCTKCYTQSYICGKICKNVCKYRRCPIYG